MNTWRAGRGGSRTSGSEGGPEKPTSREAGRALRSDPYTYCSTWSGIVYVAFVVDVYSRRIVGWKAAPTMHANLVVDALNMAAWTRRHTSLDGLICHSDAGSQPIHLDRVHRPSRRARRVAVDRHRRRQLL